CIHRSSIVYRDNLLADKLFKSIKETIPALVVAIARFFARQLLVPKSQFCTAVALEKFDCHDASPVLPIFVFIPLPREDTLLSGNEFTAFAERAHLLPFRSGQVPAVFSANAHVRCDISGRHAFWSKPLS